MLLLFVHLAGRASRTCQLPWRAVSGAWRRQSRARLSSRATVFPARSVARLIAPYKSESVSSTTTFPRRSSSTLTRQRLSTPPRGPLRSDNRTTTRPIRRLNLPRPNCNRRSMYSCKASAKSIPVTRSSRVITSPCCTSLAQRHHRRKPGVYVQLRNWCKKQRLYLRIVCATRQGHRRLAMPLQVLCSVCPGCLPRWKDCNVARRVLDPEGNCPGVGIPVRVFFLELGGIDQILLAGKAKAKSFVRTLSGS